MRLLRKYAVAIIIVMALAGCAPDTPWRKAAVTSYEIAGTGILTARDATEILHLQKAITDQNLVDAKEAYTKAVKVYIAMGTALKAAGKAQDSAQRDKFLEEFDSLAIEFKKLGFQINDIMMTFRPQGALPPSQPPPGRRVP